MYRNVLGEAFAMTCFRVLPKERIPFLKSFWSLGLRVNVSGIVPWHRWPKSAERSVHTLTPRAYLSPAAISSMPDFYTFVILFYHRANKECKI